jgi:beta-lactamase regulating signal transducer with metallopeptidase domain
MQVFWEIVASNALMVAVLAAVVALLGRIWKNPVGLHLLWILVLLKLVTPPVVTLPVPLPVTQSARISTEHAVMSGSATPETRTEIVAENAGSAAANRHPQRVLDDRMTVGSPTAGIAVTPAMVEGHETSWLVVLAWIWGVGVALFAIGRAYRIVRFCRLLRAAQPPAAAVLNMAEGIGKRLGLRRVPQIMMLPARLSPMVWSLGGRPRVVLPAELFERLDSEAQAAILAHELAHVRRNDHWVRLLELVATTLFWWHPVVWWACRQLQELEEQCCDCVVLGLAPHGARTYATALLDTLDFLSERSVVAPMGATAARLSVSLTRRISMFKEHSPMTRLTVGRLALLAAVAAFPMVFAFAAEPPKTDAPKSDEKPPVQRRAINKLVKDFPEKVDLSTPESASAAYERAWARLDAKAVWELGWLTPGPNDIEETERFMKHDAKDPESFRKILLGTEIVEVLTYRDDLAAVITKISVPEDAGHFAVANPFSDRSFGRINGVWKNLGEDRLPSVEAARENFESKKNRLWDMFVKDRDSIKQGKPLPRPGQHAKRSMPMAPGEPMGISVEKADLMGRIEWAMMHGGRDITARKSIEWGDVEKDKDGNRTLRYKYYATIWDKDVMIMNQVFTFDTKGNILDVDTVEGFPQKKVEKPADVGTQDGMKALVEDFFSKNFVDITSRKTIEWGEPTKDAGGNTSIRYKYEAKIWDKDTKIINQIFTFDPKGKYVSVKDVFADLGTKEGMIDRVEDFFKHNFRDIASRETIEWGDVAKAENGNSSIRCKYRATFRNNETKIMNQIFTFDPKGDFVSVKDVEGFPQNQ